MLRIFWTIPFIAMMGLGVLLYNDTHAKKIGEVNCKVIYTVAQEATGTPPSPEKSNRYMDHAGLDCDGQKEMSYKRKMFRGSEYEAWHSLRVGDVVKCDIMQPTLTSINRDNCKKI